jgi:hypothetical protein
VQEGSVIRNLALKQFVLEFGLANHHQGRTTTLPTLLNEAVTKCGRCTRRELLDALYDLRPQDVEYQQFIRGNRGLVHPIRFERNSVHWEEFFDAEFCIQVLPEGRDRALNLSQQLKDDRPQPEPTYAPKLKVHHNAA